MFAQEFPEGVRFCGRPDRLPRPSTGFFSRLSRLPPPPPPHVAEGGGAGRTLLTAASWAGGPHGCRLEQVKRGFACSCSTACRKFVCGGQPFFRIRHRSRLFAALVHVFLRQPYDLTTTVFPPFATRRGRAYFFNV